MILEKINHFWPMLGIGSAVAILTSRIVYGTLNPAIVLSSFLIALVVTKIGYLND